MSQRSNTPLTRRTLIKIAAEHFGIDSTPLRLVGGFVTRSDGSPLPKRINFLQLCFIAARARRQNRAG